MASKRIYLGIDSHSNLAISLEPAGEGIYFLSVSAGTRGTDFCKFVLSEDALEGVLHNHPLEISGKAGQLTVHAGGDEVVFHFKRAQDEEPSSCTLSLSSFERVMKLARNRAYMV